MSKHDVVVIGAGLGGLTAAARLARAGLARIPGQTVQHGQREGRRLAGPGLGDAQKVASLKQGRNGFSLDRSGGGVTFVLDGAKDGLGQV